MSVPESTRKENGEFDVRKLCSWLVDVAITAYVQSSTRNDFIILHAVTGAWSLLQILPVLKNYQHAVDAARVYVCVFMAYYIAVGAPDLNVPLDANMRNPSKEDWDVVIEKAMSRESDEHVYKVVQVGYDMWKLNPDNGRLYIQGANCVTENPMSY